MGKEFPAYSTLAFSTVLLSVSVGPIPCLYYDHVRICNAAPALKQVAMFAGFLADGAV